MTTTTFYERIARDAGVPLSKENLLLLQRCSSIKPAPAERREDPDRGTVLWKSSDLDVEGVFIHPRNIARIDLLRFHDILKAMGLLGTGVVAASSVAQWFQLMVIIINAVIVIQKGITEKIGKPEAKVLYALFRTLGKGKQKFTFKQLRKAYRKTFEEKLDKKAWHDVRFRLTDLEIIKRVSVDPKTYRLEHEVTKVIHV